MNAASASRPRRVRRLFAEVRRRKVHRTVFYYVAGGLATLEASDLVFPRLGLPDWAVQLVLALLIVGLPLALALSWAFEITPGGLVRTPNATRADEAPLMSGGALELTPSPDFRGMPDNAPVRPVALSDQTGRPSILVAPLANGSPDPDNAFVADGITEEIITDLSRIRSLRVISRSSAMMLKGSAKTAVAVARELGVDWVLEGSVRKMDNELRITVQLIDAHADDARWSERYRGGFNELFDIQERVAHSVVQELSLQVHPDELKRTEDRIEDPHLCALVGQHGRAIRLFDRLVEVDPLTTINHAMGPFVSILEGRPSDALPGYCKFRDLDPDNPMARWCWVWVLTNSGRIEEALDWLENTIRIGNVNYPFWSRHDPWLETVRSEPRYDDLMRQVEREWRSLNPDLAVEEPWSADLSDVATQRFARRQPARSARHARSGMRPRTAQVQAADRHRVA